MISGCNHNAWSHEDAHVEVKKEKEKTGGGGDYVSFNRNMIKKKRLLIKD